MKIAISTSVIQRGKSGVARYVFELVAALLRQPGDHRLLLYVLEEDLTLFDAVRDRVELVSLPERWRSPVKNVFWHQFVLPRLLRRDGVDLLHIPSYRRMVWKAPCPMVATIHDLAPFRLAEKYDRLRMFYGRHVAKRLAARQDAILTVSEFTAGDIEHFFDIPRDRIHVTGNGIDHRRFYPDKPTDTGEPPFFLFVSRLEHPAKNHVRLIEAFDRFKTATGSDWRLVLGGSDWHGAEVIRGAAAKSRHAEAIEFPGFVSDEALPDLYRRAGALVYPSLFEGFGLPPVEAMACGCPVISSDQGSLPEVVGDAALLVDPMSVDSIEGALTTVAAYPEIRQELTEKGLTRANRFDWDETACLTLQIYREFSIFTRTIRLEEPILLRNVKEIL
jgi:glycosyltransferase involved in cell wall biosynthesis